LDTIARGSWRPCTPSNLGQVEDLNYREDGFEVERDEAE